jgi:hypothetical protein
MPKRRTKVYRDRAEYELDVQVMRAHGWVIDREYDDGLTAPNSPSGCFMGGFYNMQDMLRRRPGSIEDGRSSKRIQVTYRRQD